VQTTERYIGCKQNLKKAVNDRLPLRASPLTDRGFFDRMPNRFRRAASTGHPWPTSKLKVTRFSLRTSPEELVLRGRSAPSRAPKGAATRLNANQLRKRICGALRIRGCTADDWAALKGTEPRTDPVGFAAVRVAPPSAGSRFGWSSIPATAA
jgi:hypothetical protein